MQFFLNRFPKIKIGVYTRNYYLMYTGTPSCPLVRLTGQQTQKWIVIYPLARGRGNVPRAGNKASKFCVRVCDRPQEQCLPRQHTVTARLTEYSLCSSKYCVECFAIYYFSLLVSVMYVLTLFSFYIEQRGSKLLSMVTWLVIVTESLHPGVLAQLLAPDFVRAQGC